MPHPATKRAVCGRHRQAGWCEKGGAGKQVRVEYASLIRSETSHHISPPSSPDWLGGSHTHTVNHYFHCFHYLTTTLTAWSLLVG